MTFKDFIGWLFIVMALAEYIMEFHSDPLYFWAPLIIAVIYFNAE